MDGEVLITAAVRDAVGPGVEVRFTPRGSRRLKGIARPAALIANRAGNLGIPSGDCSTQNVAYDRWTLADLGGWLLCRVDDADAVIEWSSDDRPILGMALRRDGDLSALLRCWKAEALFLRP